MNVVLRSAGEEYPETAACEAALAMFMAHAGNWRDRVVLIGGLAPRYLVPAVPDGIEPHLGTTDVDLVLTLAVTEHASADEQPLRACLEQMQFVPRPEKDAPDGAAFRWERMVAGTRVKLEFMCPADEGVPLTIDPDPLPGSGDGLGALRLRGAELVGLDHQTREVRLRTVDGTASTFMLRVTNVLPFLVLKAYALIGRRKTKDAYDVVWVLAAYGDEEGGAAAAALASPATDAAVVGRAITILREYFGHVDGEGAIAYADHFAGGADPVQRRTLQRYAHGTVNQFLRAWDKDRRKSPAGRDR